MILRGGPEYDKIKRNRLRLRFQPSGRYCGAGGASYILVDETGGFSMGVALDSYDKAILEHLQRDSSISNLELSKQIGLSPSACLIRTKNLKEQGIIRRFTTIIDEQKLGMNILAFALVDLNPLNRETIGPFLDLIQSLPQVQECYTLTGQHSFLLKIVERDIGSYRDFVIYRLMACPAVSNVESSMVMGVEKRTTMIPVDMER